MNYKDVASKILKAVGGDKNIQHLEHCSTRLRLTLNDDSKVNVKKLKNIPEVIGVNQTGQCQIIIGNEVVEVYAELNELVSEKSNQNEKNSGKKKISDQILDFIISVFQPLIPAIAGGGILKSLLMLLNMVGVLSDTTQTYQILNFIGDAPLYFLPILVAITTAKKLKVNQLVAVSAVGTILTPGLLDMLGEGSSLFSIGLQNVNYTYQVFPAILCVLLYAQMEKLFTKISPKVIRIFFVPMMSLLITVPVTLIVLGPLGFQLGQIFASVVLFIFAKVGWFAIATLAAVLPFMVATGMHKAMIPYAITSFAQTGKEIVYLTASLAHNIAEGGGCFAVALRTKDKTLKATAISAGISAIFGITEPALYGVTILHKRVLYGVMIGAFTGGAFLGVQSVEAYAAVGPGVASLSMFISETMPQNIINAIIGLIISFAVSFIAVLILWKEEEVTAEVEEDLNIKEEFIAPVAGEIIALSEVNDDVFSNKVMGEGIAIIPAEGKLFAPVSGTIEAIYDTKHAIGIKSDNGTEILFHVGLDTVNLQGKYFNEQVSVGDHVNQGDLLLDFELEKIIEAGFDPVTIAVITNRPDVELETNNKTQVQANDIVFAIN